MENPLELYDADLTESGNQDGREWLTVSQLARRLVLRESHIRALVRRGDLPVVRVGRLLRFHWPTVKSNLLTEDQSNQA